MKFLKPFSFSNDEANHDLMIKEFNIFQYPFNYFLIRETAREKIINRSKILLMTTFFFSYAEANDVFIDPKILCISVSLQLLFN